MTARPEDRGRLIVQFADHASQIDCTDAALLACLAALLRHCRAGPSDPAALSTSTFEVRPDEGATWLLLKDGCVVDRGFPTPEVVERLIYEVTLALATSCRTSLVVHGAGLVRGNVGLVLCGESGCGKSTLATWLTATGSDFLSDELVALGIDGSAMTGFPRPIVLKSDSAVVGQPWWDPPVPTPIPFPGGRIYLDPEQLRPNSVRAHAGLRVLVFPRYSPDGPLAIHRLTQAEAAYRLMPRLVNAAILADRGFQAVTRLVRAVPAYGLSYTAAAAAVGELNQLWLDAWDHGPGE
ncbi:MAG TPA: hypothetical protein VNL16_15145 [Chloroflexota bacterium]|nr:hypothetical protein [Chloroflexota bacterium]